MMLSVKHNSCVNEERNEVRPLPVWWYFLSAQIMKVLQTPTVCWVFSYSNVGYYIVPDIYKNTERLPLS